MAGADAVAAYSRTTEKPAGLGHRLHGVADVGQAAAGDHGGDAGVEAGRR